MPLFRLPPDLPQQEYDQFGRAYYVLMVLMLVLRQRFFDLVSAIFGGLSVYFICVRLPLQSYDYSERQIGFVGGADLALLAHRWRVSLSLAVLHSVLVFNWFGAVMRCRWLARRRRKHAGHWEAPQDKAVVQVDHPRRDLGVELPAD